VHNLRVKLANLCIGYSFGCLVDEEGDVYAYGNNYRGELGLGDTDPRIFPTAIPTLKGKFC
jgi:hypothetical protein